MSIPKPKTDSAFATGHPLVTAKSEGQQLWDKLHDATVPSVRFSQSFMTLRDMIQEAEIDAKALTKVRRLGEGAFAVVDKCVYKTEDGMKRNVAVKRLKHDVFKSEWDLHDFVREALLLKKLSNGNIVDFIGMGADMERAHVHPSEGQPSGISQECIFLVTEFMTSGTLYSTIVKQMKSSRTIYTTQQGLKWLIEVAKGMKYLHNSNPCVIHRDLKIENVLLTDDSQGNQIAKIGDFGLHALVPPKKNLTFKKSSRKILNRTSKRFMEHTKTIKLGKQAYGDEVFKLSGRTGSLMYMAPEVLKSEPYNEKADVFSFGIVIYEVLQKCLLLAFVSLKGRPSEVEQYIDSVIGGFRPYIPKCWPKELHQLLRRCWTAGISERASMDEVLEALLEIQEKGLLFEKEPVKKAGCTCCAQQ